MRTAVVMVVMVVVVMVIANEDPEAVACVGEKIVSDPRSSVILNCSLPQNPMQSIVTIDWRSDTTTILFYRVPDIQVLLPRLGHKFVGNVSRGDASLAIDGIGNVTSKPYLCSLKTNMSLYYNVTFCLASSTPSGKQPPIFKGDYERNSTSADWVLIVPVAVGSVVLFMAVVASLVWWGYWHNQRITIRRYNDRNSSERQEPPDYLNITEKDCPDDSVYEN